MKHYLFDFDGTLVDSMPAYSKMILRILDEAKVSYPKDIVKTVTPLGTIETAKLFIRMGVQGSVDDIQNKMRQYILNSYLYDIPAKPYVIETLKILKNRGADLHVLTASPHLTLDPCLKRLGIYDIFSNVWSCNDFDTTKANPEIYRMVAQKIHATVDEILFLDDNLDATKTAMVTGMHVCGVYDDSSKEYETEMCCVLEYYIKDFSQLPDLT